MDQPRIVVRVRFLIFWIYVVGGVEIQCVISNIVIEEGAQRSGERFPHHARNLIPGNDPERRGVNGLSNRAAYQSNALLVIDGDRPSPIFRAVLSHGHASPSTATRDVTILSVASQQNIPRGTSPRSTA